MSNTNKIKEVGMVYETTDYDIFSFIKGNRTVNENTPHVKKLVKMFQYSGYLFTPIIVNEYYEIIDGQNRYFAAKQLLLPIRYIQIEKYGINEVRIYNQLQSNWSSSTYIESFSVEGNYHYTLIKSWLNKYRFTTINQILPFLKGYALGYNIGRSKKNASNVITNGSLHITNELAIETKLRLALEIYDVIDLVKTQYLNTSLSNLFDVKGYDHARMIDRLLNSGLNFEKQVSSKKYDEQLDKFYNYHMKTGKLPISFLINELKLKRS